MVEARAGLAEPQGSEGFPPQRETAPLQLQVRQQVREAPQDYRWRVIRNHGLCRRVFRSGFHKLCGHVWRQQWIFRGESSGGSSSGGHRRGCADAGAGNYFRAASTYPLVGNADWISIADLDGNGTLDVVAAESSAGFLGILVGDGDGGFPIETNYSLPSGARSIAPGDFGDQGQTYLAIADSLSNVDLLLSTGGGSFIDAGGFLAGPNLLDVISVRFRPNGPLDLVTVNSDTNSITVFLGDGKGVFSTLQSYDAGYEPIAVAGGDFNGDGIEDLVIGDRDYLVVMLGDGTGNLKYNSTYSVDSFGGVAVGDFNGDGKADLAVGDDLSGRVDVLAGLGDGTFAAPVSYFVCSGLGRISVGDVNGDGLPDIVTAGAQIGILWGSTTGLLRGPVCIPSELPSGLGVAVGDFNSDGWPDVAIEDPDDATVSIVINTGCWAANDAGPNDSEGVE